MAVENFWYFGYFLLNYSKRIGIIAAELAINDSKLSLGRNARA